MNWLSAAELDSWLSVVRLITWLPWSIDQQLQRDSKLGMVDTRFWPCFPKSTANHADELTCRGHQRIAVPPVTPVKRLERRGLIRREPDPTDGRFTNAILTDKGFQMLAEAAPRHVAHVRSLIIDVFSPEQLRRLGRDANRIMSRIDTSGIN